MAGDWNAFLQGSAAGHAVEIYVDSDELGDSVSRYLGAGFAEGEPALVLATPDHVHVFTSQLELLGWPKQLIEEEGLLEVADVEQTLAKIMDGALPSRSRFEQVVGGLVDELAERFPGKHVRAFGEIVNVLSEHGRHDAAALELETLWNDLLSTRPLTILCGYRLDIFDRAAQVGVLPDVCHLHSHVQLAHDPGRLSRAVDLALEEVLGYEESGKVYFLVSSWAREKAVPVAQLVLMWVSENMPTSAGRILASARARYYDQTVVPANV